MVAHATGATNCADDYGPNSSFICDVCDRECCACMGVSESETCDECHYEALVRVCPGCYAVAPERCLPGCIDAEMAREREDEQLYGTRDNWDDDEDDE